ncbi:IS1 family transposase [Endozoicomonas sp.]|uniref:IS1 family transposase n=1 Tax=Endozoicomonas sp. TaxID=1892382 RepID=UPI003AF56995
MAVVQVACIHCQQTINVVKNGKAETGHQRYRCKDCNKSFQLEYRYNGNLPGTHEQIIKMTMNGSGVRDIGRVLEISPTTVLGSFKKLDPPTVTQLPFENAQVKIIFEMDEQWSFVGSKKQQRWLFYAWEPRFKKIIAHAFGSRSTETLKKLLGRLARFKVSFYCTDDWQPYTSCLPEDKHIIGKHFTQRIERQNLTLRTCLKRLSRRTICFSRSIDIHDKVIGEFISRNHYQQF